MYGEKTWKNSALVPLWIAHLTFLLIFIAVLAVSMMEYAGDHEGKNNASLTAFMIFFVIALIMSPLEMVLQSHRFLEPWLYLSFQMYKVTFSVIFVIVEIVDYTTADWTSLAGWIRYLMLVLIIVTIVMGLSFFASLMYGAIVVHRHRKARSLHASDGFVKERYHDNYASLESQTAPTHLASGAMR